MTDTVIINFNCLSSGASSIRSFGVEGLIIAGWTGRNKQAMEAHISELEELGVSRPRSTPIFYRISTARLTTAENIQVSGKSSSGEVEFVLVNIDGDIWIGVGSDHTDRKVETYGVTVSKQMCDKPLAGELWPIEEVNDHWDSLVVRSYVVNDDVRELYQEGTVELMLNPKDLMSEYKKGNDSSFQPGELMFGGTIASIGEIRSSEQFEFELEDPVLNRKISHKYSIESLPVME